MAPSQLRGLFHECRLPLVRKFAARRLTEEISRAPQRVDPLVALLGAEKTTAPAPDGGQRNRAPDALRLEILEGMSDALRGWRRAPAPAGWPAVAGQLAGAADQRVAALARELSATFGDGRALGELRKIAEDAQADAATRRQALRGLIDARADGLAALLQKLVADRAVDLEAVQGLAAVDDAATPRRILDAYPRMDPETRAAAVSTLASRATYARALLEAIEAGQVRRQDVSAFHARQIRNLGDNQLSTRLNAVWGEVRETGADRARQFERRKAALDEAALAKADLSRGRALFNKTCASCHVLFGQGQTAGPDLTGSNRANLDYLLENILDPSASVAADFRMTVFAMMDGRVVSGVVVEAAEKTITVRTEKERVVLLREEIEESRPTNTSLMPEGLLETLSAEEVRDLFGYLRSPRQVALPAE
jgi:putative heme-binding domain-containing protein